MKQKKNLSRCNFLGCIYKQFCLKAAGSFKHFGSREMSSKETIQQVIEITQANGSLKERMEEQAKLLMLSLNIKPLFLVSPNCVCNLEQFYLEKDDSFGNMAKKETQGNI